jgi:NTE family protein
MPDADLSARERYLPHERGKRAGIALCLSGGGYRAALFHLGALRRLNELGVLGHVTTICTVSGGSILASLLADRIRPWPDPGDRIADFDARVSAPFVELTRKNIRTGWVFKRLLPTNWTDSGVAVRTLEERYRKDLTALELTELPDRPRYVFCATDMSFGANWIFERARMGSYQAGYVKPPPWPVARAVAASSCFPPAFEPLPIGPELASRLRGGKARSRPDFAELCAGLRLTDGGVYDNLGLEPVWKTHDVLLVSDGGGTFDFRPDAGVLGRLGRYQGIQGRQIGALRKRWLLAGYLTKQFKGAYWGIGSAVDSYKHAGPGYPEDLVAEVISEVRTDLDHFTEAERAVLVNHGGAMADAAIRTHAGGLADPAAPAPAAPYPEWMDPARVRDALAGSHRRKALGRWPGLQLSRR